MLFLKKDDDGAVEPYRDCRSGRWRAGRLPSVRNRTGDVAIGAGRRRSCRDDGPRNLRRAAGLGTTCGPHRSVPPSVTLVVSWSPADASRPKRFWPRPRPTPTPTPKKEPDMPLARRRLRRTAAVVGGAAVVAHGVNRRATGGKTAETTVETAARTGETADADASGTTSDLHRLLMITCSALGAGVRWCAPAARLDVDRPVPAIWRNPAAGGSGRTAAWSGCPSRRPTGRDLRRSRPLSRRPGSQRRRWGGRVAELASEVLGALLCGSRTRERDATAGAGRAGVCRRRSRLNRACALERTTCGAGG